jgi:hypothetical protein
MSQQLILIIMGGAFILLGIGFLIWGKYEEQAYYITISRRFDVREFLERMPWRPEPLALKIGGRIAVVLGVLLLIAGFIVWILKVTLT